jgi:hypothetical protein
LGILLLKDLDPVPIDAGFTTFVQAPRKDGERLSLRAITIHITVHGLQTAHGSLSRVNVMNREACRTRLNREAKQSHKGTGPPPCGPLTRKQGVAL